jgi:hypothetical protein
MAVTSKSAARELVIGWELSWGARWIASQVASRLACGKAREEGREGEGRDGGGIAC